MNNFSCGAGRKKRRKKQKSISHRKIHILTDKFILSFYNPTFFILIKILKQKKLNNKELYTLEATHLETLRGIQYTYFIEIMIHERKNYILYNKILIKIYFTIKRRKDLFYGNGIKALFQELD